MIPRYESLNKGLQRLATETNDITVIIAIFMVKISINISSSFSISSWLFAQNN